MNVQSVLLPSAFKHIKGHPLPQAAETELTVLKGERFAVQLGLKSDEPALLTLANFNSIGHQGLTRRLRLSIEPVEGINVTAAFIGYVPDDCGTQVADPILREQSQYIEAGLPQLIWIEGEVSSDYNEASATIRFNLWSQQGYEPEERLTATQLNLDVINKVMPSLANSDFHLDLWQHLSSWARMYEVPLWSDNHFSIIENYIAELASMGAKVITVVASDFPWAGQGCYRLKDRQANLFEHKIIGVTRTRQGTFACDFTALERYLTLCFNHGIDAEIDLFGLIGNWDSRLFGNPLNDYLDPIRINYFCEETQSYRYMNSREQLRVYLVQLFDFFRQRGLLDKVRLISDEPDNVELFEEWSQFLNECSGGEVPIKAALLHDHFINEFDNLSDVSFILPLLLNRRDKLEQIKASLPGKLTWYVCCFPEKPNHFLSSPLIESRLTGWFSYFFASDGFLRWDYALWPEAPLQQVSYKYPRWKAGDMFFVYPGKDMKPIRSIRWENLRFGFQDQILMKLVSDKVGRSSVEPLLESVLGCKADMHSNSDTSVTMDYSLDYHRYMTVRQQLHVLLDGSAPSHHQGPQQHAPLT